MADIKECGEDHSLALWLCPVAIRQAFQDDEGNDPTVGMTDDELEAIGYEVLDGIYDEYRRLLEEAVRA